jgi:hypothetical protein
MTKGDTLANSDARSTSYKELRKRAQELDVPGRSRMKKAELVEAVEHKEAEQAAAQPEVEVAQQREQEAAQRVREAALRELQATGQELQKQIEVLAESATQSVRNAVRETARKELQATSRELQKQIASLTQSAKDTVWEAARKEYQTAGQAVRREMRSLAQSAAQQRTPEAVREAAQQEVEAAQQRTREAVTEAAGNSAQATTPVGRASRGKVATGLQQVSAGVKQTVLTVLIAVTTALITAMATATLASDYYTSRIGDWAFRRGTPVVSTEVTLERENRVQGLTWVFHEGLGDLPEIKPCGQLGIILFGLVLANPMCSAQDR